MIEMKKNLMNLMGVGLAFSTGSVMAGESYGGKQVIEPEEQESAESTGSWCESLQDMGKLYRNKKSDFIRKIQFFGRAQYQWGYTEGTYNNVDFDGDGDDLRRFRLGVEVDITRDLTFEGSVNLEDGGFRNPHLGYRSFDVLNLSYDFGDVGDFKNIEVTYGRQKIDIGGEGHESSRKIKTIERSNISNYFFPEKSTALMVSGKHSGVKFTAGVVSTDWDEVLAQWNKGEAYYLSANFDVPGGEMTIDGLYNDADPTEDQAFGYEWVASAAYETEIGNWDLMLNGIYGENHNGDGVYGVVVMPSTFLIEDKLEAVFRYQYAGSDGDNLRMSERNVNNVHQDVRGFRIPRGDKNQSIYAGLNYYLCEDYAKIMIGAEYEKLEGIGIGPNPFEADALTFWTAFRMYF